jgi:hypothetical protein
MPYGNINYQKRFYYNKKFTYKDFVLQKYIDDIQFCFSQEKLLDCPSIVVEVREDDGGTKQTFEYIGNNIDKASIMAFVGANSGYISKWTDQVTGDIIEITTESQQQQIINAGTWVTYTNKYNLEIPVNTALTVSGIAAVNRMKNLSMCSYIAFKGSVSISGYTADYVFPIKMSANSLNDFGITNGLNNLWYFRDDSISTADRPAVTCVASGNDYLFCTNFTANNIELRANGTGVRFIGNLKDFPRLIYYLDLYNCTLITGSLADLQGKITYYLNLGNCALITGSLADLQGKITSYLILYNCTLITGSLADLQGKITYYLNLGNCTLITGSLADLQGKITYYLTLYNCTLITGSLADLQGKITSYLNLYNCTLITGVYTPSSNTTTPTTFNITNTGLSAADLDATIIACDQAGVVKNGVTLTKTGLNRTAASDAAKLDLKTNHTWTFVPDT